MYLNDQLTIDPAKILIRCERVKLCSSKGEEGRLEDLARGSPFLRCREAGKVQFSFV